MHACFTPRRRPAAAAGRLPERCQTLASRARMLAPGRSAHYADEVDARATSRRRPAPASGRASPRRRSPRRRRRRPAARARDLPRDGGGRGARRGARKAAEGGAAVWRSRSHPSPARSSPSGSAWPSRASWSRRRRAARAGPVPEPVPPPGCVPPPVPPPPRVGTATVKLRSTRTCCRPSEHQDRPLVGAVRQLRELQRQTREVMCAAPVRDRPLTVTRIALASMPVPLRLSA